MSKAGLHSASHLPQGALRSPQSAMDVGLGLALFALYLSTLVPSVLPADNGEFQFVPGKEVWITYHIPHDYVPGTPLFFHTHWTQDGTSTLTVAGQYSVSFAKGFNQAAFDMTGVTVTSVQAGPGIAWQHMISESDPVTLTGVEVDSLVMMNLKRISHAGARNSDRVYVMTADIHYQS